MNNKLRTLIAASLFAITGLAQAACPNCATVLSVEQVKEEGKGSGMGAVAGAVAGGLLGNQLGGGRGNTIATVAGVAGGAYAGNEVEKHVRSKEMYRVEVRMEDGEQRHYDFEHAPAFKAGDKVKVEGNHLVAAPEAKKAKKK
jgi:outer membrane lipoprotein SlyB